MAFATTLGSVQIPFFTICRILLVQLPLVDITPTWPRTTETIILEIRLPRVILAGLVGAALATAGATYQGLFRNPLADPYLIGVAQGAALGAVVGAVLQNKGLTARRRDAEAESGNLGVPDHVAGLSGLRGVDSLLG